MSRRRPTDADTSYAEDALPLLASTDLANGKQRTATEKAGRFFRTRPVSSLLIIIALCAMAMITFSIGRAVVSIFGSGSSTAGSKGPAASFPDTMRHESGAAMGSKPDGMDDGVADGDGRNNDGHEDDKDKDPVIGEDEKGALVDGVDEKNVAPPPMKPLAEAPKNADGPVVRSCHRKFEPGKLGWPKTLCVTDEFFFDISVGNEPIGNLKVGVFGEVVPKSAANFRALVTCTGVFADEKLCYRGDSFHRVVTGFVAQGGSKATGKSIYGGTFREEKTKDHHSFLQHAEKGVISWAEYPIGSQFFILIRDEAVYLDGNHVVFGVVTDGMEVLDKIHDAPRTGEEPTNRVTITNCGDAHKPV